VLAQEGRKTHSLEALYQELVSSGISCEKEKKICISYKGRLVGQYRADLVVDDSIVIVTKCVEKIAMGQIYPDAGPSSCVAATRGRGTAGLRPGQAKNYLRGIDRQYGMVINFGGLSVTFWHVFV